MLKCANRSEWLVPPVWCHPTDERLLAAVRMYAVLSVNASQRRAIDSLPGGKHTISGREQTYWITTSSPSSASTLRWWVFCSLLPLSLLFFFLSNASFLGDLPCSSLQRADDSLTGSASCWKTKHSRYFGTGSVATGHEFGGTDGYMVDHARGAGIAEEDHFGSWSVSPEFPERWGGLMQAVGATQPGLHGESKDIKTPPTPSLTQSTQPTARPVCASVRCRSVKTDAVCCLASLSAHWSMRRFSFVGHGSSGYCLRKLRYMLTQTRKPIGCVSSAHRSAQ